MLPISPPTNSSNIHSLQLAGEADSILEAEPAAWQGAGSGRAGLNGAGAGLDGSQHHPQRCPEPRRAACLAQHPALPTSLPLASHPQAAGACGPQLCLHRMAFFQQHCSPSLVLGVKGLVLSPPALGCSPLSCSGAAWPPRCLRSPENEEGGPSTRPSPTPRSVAGFGAQEGCLESSCVCGSPRDHTLALGPHFIQAGQHPAWPRHQEEPSGLMG